MNEPTTSPRRSPTRGVDGPPSTRGAALEAAILAHATALYRYAYWLCGNPERAEALVDRVLARANPPRHGRHGASLTRHSLLHAIRQEITERCAITAGRRASRQRGGAGPQAAPPAAAREQAPGSERGARMRDAIGRLPSTEREPLVLEVAVGCTRREIADLLELDEALVADRLAHARATLAAELTLAPSGSGRPSLGGSSIGD